jgi:hypothetical protein
VSVVQRHRKHADPSEGRASRRARLAKQRGTDWPRPTIRKNGREPEFAPAATSFFVTPCLHDRLGLGPQPGTACTRNRDLFLLGSV